MASVYVKHGRYYARWRDAAGNRQRAVTACRTKKEAQRFAEDLERKAERQARGLETLPEDLPRGAARLVVVGVRLETSRIRLGFLPEAPHA